MINADLLLVADRGQNAIPLHLVDKASFPNWLTDQSDRARSLISAQNFRGEAAQLAILPNVNGALQDWSAVLGVADRNALGPWCLAKAAEGLPEGHYRLSGASAGAAALGWVLGQYRFERYKEKTSDKGHRILVTDEVTQIEDQVRLAQATGLVRDLVNIPAGDLGPAEIQAKVEEVAGSFGARVKTTLGSDLDSGFPMVAAVGRAASEQRAPRLVELEWGDQRHPQIAIIGKGVCFDSGGLDIKTSASMRLMKKDMGGAAHALALAWLVMKANLPVRLHLILPLVENAVSSAAFRPGDILKSRKGLTVEIGNTDAEGRLILGDALALAAEREPELILDFATLTGSARVALGPDLPALFANHDPLADALTTAATAVDDPVWRMPLWEGYEDMLSSDVADIGNVSESSFAGAVTAALFLQRFVPKTIAWGHFDTFAWRASSKPGRPKGGDALGLRAAWEMLRRKYVR